MYAWGSTINGELGIGGIENEYITIPTEMEWSHSSDVKLAALGDNHSLFLMFDGAVYSCGSNDFGQLGHDQGQKNPHMVLGLNVHRIVGIACGSYHSLAINQWGQIFSWGSDMYNQLGHNLGDTVQSIPKIVKKLAQYNIIQIAAGNRHSVGLTNSGEVIAWGANNYGQLGIGHTSNSENNPVVINILSGLPLAYITCGANHSFVISKCGVVFGWGKNSSGQLGTNDNQVKYNPTHLKTFRNIKVRYISCGEDFSAFLTSDGGLFTCGLGTYGQLGHGCSLNEILPRQVVELMGTTVTQIACGRQHTLAFAPNKNRLFSFGLGGLGQLGLKKLLNANTPQVVSGPWMQNQNNVEQITIRNIFAGGDHCFILSGDSNNSSKHTSSSQSDHRIYEGCAQICSIDYQSILKVLDIPEQMQIEQDLISYLETSFANVACWNASFLKDDEGGSYVSSQRHGLDIESAERAFSVIGKLENSRVKDVIWNSISENLLDRLPSSPLDIEALRICVLLPMYHEFNNSKHYITLHTKFARAVYNLPTAAKDIVGQWWLSMSNDYFERLISNFKSVIITILRQQNIAENSTVTFDINLVIILDFLSFLVHLIRSIEEIKVAYDCFYVPELEEYVDVRFDYLLWLSDQSTHNLYLCNYPFVFDAKAKTRLLETDQIIQMEHAMHNAFQSAFLTMLLREANSAPVTQFLILNITREHIVNDALRELSKVSSSDLKKPLKIRFCGEEAEDAGGVKKEFFMLLLRDILDPKYGMFKEFEETRVVWFSENSFEEDAVYFLIGMICGLAIYNSTIIDIPFPLALYKKLLNEVITLSDLKYLSPTMANSMQALLDYSDVNFQETFGLSFEITTNSFGTSSIVELKPGGSQIPVTNANKNEYIDLYVDYIFNTSVKKQYEAFHSGFMKVCGGRVLQLFHSHELMAVVVGNENYDWYALEESAEYKNGYKSSDQVIRWFWEVVHEMPLADKKKFLLFLTGSDRIPIQGMNAIKVIIQPTHNDNFLPVAHTCFNLLDLPRYNTKEKLKYKLIQAIQQTEGFSLV